MTAQRIYFTGASSLKFGIRTWSYPAGSVDELLSAAKKAGMDLSGVGCHPISDELHNGLDRL